MWFLSEKLESEEVSRPDCADEEEDSDVRLSCLVWVSCWLLAALNMFILVYVVVRDGRGGLPVVELSVKKTKFVDLNS